MTTAADLPADKMAQRRAIRARRRAVPAAGNRHDDALAIAAVAEQLALSRLDRSSAGAALSWVAAYESLPTEPPTEVLIERLQAHGIRVMVPLLLPDLDLDWREADPGHESGAGPTALGRNAIGWANLIIIPALAIDRHGVRLGQGGGSYDRALVRRDAGSLVAAVVHDDELVDGPLPHEEHDQRVDAAITPGSGLVDLADGSSAISCRRRA